MNILHLKYAVEVEKTGSITQAAERLFMGQPNLSKAIRELETSLGISIFKRTSKGVVSTQEGEIFLKYAKSIIAQVDAVESLYSPKRQNKLDYIIGISQIDYVSDAFITFASSFVSKTNEEKYGTNNEADICEVSEISFELRETDTLAVINMVESGECRLGVIRYNIMQEDYYRTFLRDKGIVSDHLIKFEYIVMMKSGHPLSGRSFVTPEELVPYTELTCINSGFQTERGKDAADTNTDENTCKRRRISVSCYSMCYDYLSRLNSAYTITSPKTPDFLAEHGYIARPCRFENNIYRDVIIYKSDKRRSDIDDRLIAKIHHARDIIRA